MNPKCPLAGINGFGRFGLGLFRAWFNDANSCYSIAFINDDVLTINDIHKILTADPIVVDFHNLSIIQKDDTLLIKKLDGCCVEIVVSTGPMLNTSWIGSPDILFECSGITRDHSQCHNFITGNTKNVIVASVIKNADTILVMGYNHSTYNKLHDKVISFGSCTVIPGVHVISFLERHFKVTNCFINIIHSVPKWQLDVGRWKTIERKKCTLENVAPQIIQSLHPSKIKVNYTYAPYYGTSLMDFEFTIQDAINKTDFINLLLREIKEGQLRGIISLIDNDTGAESQDQSQFSIVIIKSSIDIRGNRLYFFGYFNNEGSGIRLHELAQYILAENNPHKK